LTIALTTTITKEQVRNFGLGCCMVWGWAGPLPMWLLYGLGLGWAITHVVAVWFEAGLRWAITHVVAVWFGA